MSLVAGLAACSTYDSSLLDDSGGALQRSVAASNAGSAALEDSGTPEAPAGGNEPVCGDGQVALSEKCDIAIPYGRPGACPILCPPLADCLTRTLVGVHCQAECAVLAHSCSDADGCCPAGCNSLSDNDCSQRCGDGVVQYLDGETCEPQSPSLPCTTAAECDDHDPCTADVLVGSADNCNTHCTHAEIKSLSAGDGCCPEGANANGDGDCMPSCGNGVREDGEECDGGHGCDAACKLTLTSEQVACHELIGEQGDDCDRCSCTQCAPERLGCVDSGDDARDGHCSAIIECANDRDCAGAACYCADRYCLEAGPCRGVIDAAVAADPSGESVIDQGEDPSTAVGRARLVGECKIAHCADVCP